MTALAEIFDLSRIRRPVADCVRSGGHQFEASEPDEQGIVELECVRCRVAAYLSSDERVSLDKPKAVKQ